MEMTEETEDHFWTRDSPSFHSRWNWREWLFPCKDSPSFHSRWNWREWLFPVVTTVLLLSLIIALGVSNTRSENRFSSVENNVVSSLSQVQAKDTRSENRFSSVENNFANLTTSLQTLLSSLSQVQAKDTRSENRFSSVENNFANLTTSLQTLLSSLSQVQAKDTRSENRFSSVENNVANLTTSLQTLLSSLSQVQAKDTRSENRFSSVENNVANLTTSLQTLLSSLSQVQAKVAEVVKSVEGVESLMRTVAGLNCSLDKINNLTAVGSGCCPLGWDLYRDGCYFFSTNSLSWHGARDWCSNQGGHLVILNTDQEWDYVNNLAKSAIYWVGLSDERTGSWEWVDQTPYIMNRRRWNPGQPDNWDGHDVGGTEDCAQLQWTGLLNDMHCTTQLRYVCQKHA